jgi:hypothetical protein
MFIDSSNSNLPFTKPTNLLCLPSNSVNVGTELYFRKAMMTNIINFAAVGATLN